MLIAIGLKTLGEVYIIPMLLDFCWYQINWAKLFGCIFDEFLQEAIHVNTRFPISILLIWENQMISEKNYFSRKSTNIYSFAFSENCSHSSEDSCQTVREEKIFHKNLMLVTFFFPLIQCVFFCFFFPSFLFSSSSTLFQGWPLVARCIRSNS